MNEPVTVVYVELRIIGLRMSIEQYCLEVLGDESGGWVVTFNRCPSYFAIIDTLKVINIRNDLKTELFQFYCNQCMQR